AWNGSFSSSLKIGRPPGSGSVSAASRSAPYSPLSRFLRTRARTSARIASRSMGCCWVIRESLSTVTDLSIQLFAELTRDLLACRVDANVRLRRWEHPPKLAQATLLWRLRDSLLARLTVAPHGQSPCACPLFPTSVRRSTRLATRTPSGAGGPRCRPPATSRR